MPQEDHGRSQMNHPEEVIRIPLPARDDAAEVMKPGEEAFDLPAPAIATQRSAILGASAPVWPMRSNQFDVVLGGEMVIEPIAIVRFVADQSVGECLEETRRKGGVDEGDFMRRSAGHVDGERKTMAVANRHDFAPLTASSRADGGAPFFAELKLASMKASLRSSFPRSRRSSANRVSSRRSTPVRCHA